MNIHLANLANIAREISKQDPLLGYDLNKHVFALSVINPGAKASGDEIENVVFALKEIQSALKEASKEHDDAAAAKVISEGLGKFELPRFEDVDEEWVKTAGVKDWVKGLFKGKKKEEPEEPSGSYNINPDAFVEGESDWAEPSAYIEQETKERGDFFSKAKKFIGDYEKLSEAVKRQGKKMISRNTVEELLREISELIKWGHNLIGGQFEHLTQMKKVVEEEDKPKNQKKAPETKKLPEGWRSTLDNYVSLIGDADEDKEALKYLKELFSKLGPALQPEAPASIASMRRKAADSYVLSLSPLQRKLSKGGKFEISRDPKGWTVKFLNVDGHGTDNVGGKWLPPSEALEIVNKHAVLDDPITQEVITMLQQEASGGNVGIPRSMPVDVSKYKFKKPTWEDLETQPYSIWDPSLASIAVKRLINIAHANPDTRPILLPIIRKLVNV